MRWWIWLLGFVIIIISIALTVLPYGIEWYVEEYDQELIGRENIVDDIDLNLITGKAGIEGFVMYEHNQQDTFLQADLLETHLAWRQLFQDKIHLRTVHLLSPRVQILQRGDTFSVKLWPSGKHL